MLQIAQITIIGLCLLVTAATQANLPESCDNEGGVCIQLTKCPYAFELLKQKNLNYLRNISCGFNNTQPLVCCKLQKTEDSIQFNPQSTTDAYYVTPRLPESTQPHKHLVQTTTNPTQIYSSTSAKGFIASNVNNTIRDTANNVNRVSDHAHNAAQPQESNVGNVLNQAISGPTNFLRPQNNSANGVVQGDTRPINNFLQEVNTGSILDEVYLNVPINTNNNSFISLHLPDKSVCGTESLGDRIYGGDITAIDEFPWMARLKYKDESNVLKYLCGGALISDRYVLTAAHCINAPKTLIEVRLGEWNSEEEVDCDMLKNCNDPPEDIAVEKAIVHPSYTFNNRFIYADIALLRLQRAVKFTKFIAPICLPSTPAIADKDISYDLPYWAAGWGITEYGTAPAIKHKVSLKAVEWETCRVSFNVSNEIASKVICAGGRRGEDTCQGDSGGPLMRMASDSYSNNWYLFGIVSLGTSFCGQAGRPAVYTRVSAYMDWINSELRS